MTGVEAVSNGVPGIQAARGEERRRDDADDGGAVDHDVPRDHAARARVPSRAERAGDRRLADRARCLRRPRVCRTTSCRPPRCSSWCSRPTPPTPIFRGSPRSLRAIGYLPRQFMNQGDRLAFSNGIIGLSIFAGISAGDVRRRHALAHSALHDRRVRVVHAFAGRDGGALAAPARSRAGRPAPRSTASAPW